MFKMNWFLSVFATCLTLHGVLVCCHGESDPHSGVDDPILDDSLPIIKALTESNQDNEQVNQIGFFDACILNIKDWLQNTNGGLAIKDPCENLGINAAYRKCTQIQHVDMESQVLDQDSMSGQEVVSAFERFCGKRDAIHSCVEDYLKNSTCSDVVVEEFHEYSTNGEYYCDGSRLRESVAKIYQHIPAVGTKVSSDECMALAFNRHNTCLLPHLLIALLQNKRDILKMEWKLYNLVCVMKGFRSKECPLKKGILTTTILHSHLLVPPTYGLNVTKYIVEMENYFRQRTSKKKHIKLLS